MRLRAALENLADNAVKFTERGRVAMTVARRARAAQAPRIDFRFTDSGIGLSARKIKRCSSVSRRQRDDRAALWRRRARARVRASGSRRRWAATSRLRAGRAGQHVSSHRDWSSSTARDQRRRAAPQRRRDEALRVLCAEDNPYARIVLNTVLAELGHAVDFAGTGEAAVAAVERGRHDLVLMDVTLPGMDGLAATRAIRALNGPAAHVAIIGISGRSEPRDAQTALAAGMNAFLVKPVSPAVLAEAIAALARGLTLAPGFASSTIRTTSAMMRLSSKSFGV